MGRWGIFAAIAAALLAAVGVCGAWLMLGAAPRAPDYVLRVPLPGDVREIGLPRIEGPADASRPLVVIDAGHGGHDPGASGAGILREKEMTLELALGLREALLADGRVRVALTRDSDRFLVLEERAGIARRLGADLFISLHADAAENAEASGATIYTLSDQASDAVADALARRENRADTVNGVSLSGRNDAVSSILVDLARREMRELSLLFAALVVREGEGALRFHEEPERQAAFVVLKSLDLPSALIEAGYISNDEDAAQLRDPAWRSRFSASVARAVVIFLARKQAPALSDQPLSAASTSTP